ncbi:MAG: UPF0280 family protein [Odoribacter sp.]|nr:UPF0280 family protein [Odoribacter sp.]
MKQYIDRTYRHHFRHDRWHYFTVTYKETDLCIGVDAGSWLKEMYDWTNSFVIELRNQMDTWIANHPTYAQSLVPCETESEAPAIFRQMAEASRKSGIGPMSAVAGAVAQYTGRALQEHFCIQEIMVENGGDIYINLCEDADISVFAGSSPLSERVGLHIHATDTPLGICTSAGTVGPSFSFGKADAVMIVCKDTLLADTYATAFANRIQTQEDISPCIEQVKSTADILGAITIKDDTMGICGKFELKIF